MMKLTLPNDIDCIPQLSEFIESASEEYGIDMTTAISLNLAVEEAVVNVMSYAYPEGTTGLVDIETGFDDGVITVVVSDNGQPFDPTTCAEVDTTLSAEERPIGGLGVHLIRQIMDTVSYQRQDNRNILTLTKNIHPNNL